MSSSRVVVSLVKRGLSGRHLDGAWMSLFCGRVATNCRTPWQPSVCCMSTSPDSAGNGNGISKNVEENLQRMRDGTFDKEVSHPEKLKHFRKVPTEESNVEERRAASGPVQTPPIGAHAMPHPIWSQEELEAIQVTHMTPTTFVDKVAYGCVRLLRFSFDAMSGYNRPERNEKIWLNRICFLETVAGVPGMVAAMVRHLHSLRRMRRDHGWIHTLLEEAENERMHLMTALQLKKPGRFFRSAVVFTQGFFVAWFSVAYLVSPRFCHRFVGYLEEEAVRTYSKLLMDMESGPMEHWNTQPAPEMAITYWHLESDATMKDVILAIRADEAHHRVVNHTLGSMKPDDYNPYKPGK